MVSKILFSFIAAKAALLATSGPATAKVPSDCSKESLVSVDEVGEALSAQSVAIIDLARQGDPTGLVTLIAPTARFTVWEGDVGIGRKDGPAGAVEFAQRIGATDYRYITTFAGPLSTDVCGTQAVTIWLTRPNGQRSYIAVFKYHKGVLIEAVATMGQLSEGHLTN